MIFGPKPPPMNGAITRTCDSARPSIARQAVADRNRRLRRVPDGELFRSRVPRGDDAAVLDGRRRAAVVAEPARDDDVRRGAGRRVVALRADATWAARLESRWSCIARRAGASAASRSTDRRPAARGPRRCRPARPRRRSGSRPRPSRAARPTCRTLSLRQRHLRRSTWKTMPGIGGGGTSSGPGLPVVARGRRPCRPRRHRAAARARCDVDRRRRACASSLRRKATCSIPGSCTSSTKSARPVSSRASSLRGHALAEVRRVIGTSQAGRRAHGLDDVGVAGAAAEMARKRLADVAIGRGGVVAQEGEAASSGCRACRSRTAARALRGMPACSGCSRRRAAARPSTVVDAWPSACTANIRQERTGSPSRSTVQAPQTPCSQPTCVPVSSRSWRRKSLSRRRGSTSRAIETPLTVSRTVTKPDTAPLQQTRRGRSSLELKPRA